jgi:Spy/CpxP family protein refolding chaperone
MDKSWRVIFAFVGIFIAGTISGGLITLRVVQKVSERRNGPPFRFNPGGQNPNQNPNSGQPPQYGTQLFRRITAQLDLTEDQSEKIKPIELRANEDLRRVRRDAQHATEVILERTQDEIAAVLTPEQRAKFEELVAKGRERVKKFMQDQEFQMRQRREQNAPNRPRDGAPPKDK